MSMITSVSVIAFCFQVDLHHMSATLVLCVREWLIMHVFAV